MPDILIHETKNNVLHDLNNAIRINSMEAFGNCLDARLEYLYSIGYERGLNAQR